ncbi:MAG: SMI1/KNR4 family protein, partial [Lachnospiraceae bacterium]|nr:SMI1/KNR4 family protein [Lachnospiraceae bacterium]
MKLRYNLSLSELMDFFCDTGQGHQGFSAGEVKAAEKRLGVSLPFMYRDFLLTYGKDPVTTKNNKLLPPNELYLRCDGEEEYLILWHGNPFVWIAGYLKKDLVDVVPDPPVFLCFCEDEEPGSFTKCADDAEAFLLIMLRDAACGWHGGERLKKRAEIERVLSNAGIDQRRLQIPDRSGTCLDGERLYFYCESGSSRELRIAYRAVPERKAAEHLCEAVETKAKQSPKAIESSGVPPAVVFSFGGDSWLNYEPRRAVSKYYESTAQEMR